MEHDSADVPLPGRQVQGRPGAQALPIQDDVLLVDIPPQQPLEDRIYVCNSVWDGRPPLALPVPRVVVGAQVRFQVLGNLAASHDRERSKLAHQQPTCVAPLGMLHGIVCSMLGS